MPYRSTVLVGLHLRLALSGFLLPNVSQCLNVFFCRVCVIFFVVVLLPPLFPLSLSLSSLSSFLVLLAFLWLVPNLSFLAASGELQIVKLSMWLIVPRPQINNVETMINGAGIVHLNCCQLWQLLKTPPPSRVWLESGKGKSKNCFDCSFQFCRLWLTRGAWPFNWVQPSLPFPSPFYHSLLIFCLNKTSQITENFRVFVDIRKIPKTNLKLSFFFFLLRECVCGRSRQSCCQHQKNWNCACRRATNESSKQQAALYALSIWPSDKVQFGLIWQLMRWDDARDSRVSRAMLGDAIWQSLFSVEWIILGSKRERVAERDEEKKEEEGETWKGR